MGARPAAAWRAVALAALPFVKYQRVYDSQRSYGGSAMACTDCGELQGHDHRPDCKTAAAIEKVNVALADLGMKPVPE
jgi:hypothetical protein